MHTYHVKQDANLSRGGRREECQQAYSQKILRIMTLAHNAETIVQTNGNHRV